MIYSHLETFDSMAIIETDIVYAVKSSTIWTSKRAAVINSKKTVMFEQQVIRFMLDWRRALRIIISAIILYLYEEFKKNDTEANGKRISNV